MNSEKINGLEILTDTWRGTKEYLTKTLWQDGTHDENKGGEKDNSFEINLKYLVSHNALSGVALVVHSKKLTSTPGNSFFFIIQKDFKDDENLIWFYDNYNQSKEWELSWEGYQGLKKKIKEHSGVELSQSMLDHVLEGSGTKILNECEKDNIGLKVLPEKKYFNLYQILKNSCERTM